MQPPTPKRPVAVPESRRLMKLLVELGGDTIINEAGETITRDEALARTLWDLALGGIETGTGGETKFRRPDKQVAMFIMERREGKTPTAVADEGDTFVIADRLDELARSRINSEADALDAVPVDASGLDGPGDGPEDSEGPDAEPVVADQSE